MSKYEIIVGVDNVPACYRYGEICAYPNNAELQFWAERNAAREQRDALVKAVKALLAGQWRIPCPTDQDAFQMAEFGFAPEIRAEGEAWLQVYAALNSISAETDKEKQS